MTSSEFLGHVPGIAAALASCNDPHTVEEVTRRLAVEEDLTLWGDERALIISRDLPDQKAIHFWIATGELDAVRELSQKVLRYAEEMGYYRATLIGRRGWVRALYSDGWSETSVVMQKEL